MSNESEYEAPGRRLRGAAAPVDAYREEMWEVVSRAWTVQAVRRKRRRALRAWGGAGLGIAAVLVLGIFIGRLSSPGIDGGGDIDAGALVLEERSVEPRLPASYRLAVGEHFQQAETLLVLFGSDEEADAGLTRLARELAATSRLLMDSRAGEDAEVRAMLLDLELLLTQIARLVDNRDAIEREVVRESVEESAVLARLRGMTSDRTTSGSVNRTGI